MTDGGMQRLVVVGREDTIIPFRAAGLRTVTLAPGPDAAAVVQKLIDEGCQVLFFTEDLVPYLAGLCDRYRSRPVPCLVPLPLGQTGSAGEQGWAHLRAVVRRAVGADVFKTHSPAMKGAVQ